MKKNKKELKKKQVIPKFNYLKFSEACDEEMTVLQNAIDKAIEVMQDNDIYIELTPMKFIEYIASEINSLDSKTPEEISELEKIIESMDQKIDTKNNTKYN